MSGTRIFLYSALTCFALTANGPAAPATDSQHDPANPNAVESPARSLPSLMDSAPQTNPGTQSGSSSRNTMEGMHGMKGMKDMPGMASAPAQSSHDNVKDMPGMASSSNPAASNSDSMKNMPGMNSSTSSTNSTSGSMNGMTGTATNSAPTPSATDSVKQMPGMASSPTPASPVPESTTTQPDASSSPAPATSNLTNPLYIHVLINHIPEMGLGISLLALFLGLVFRSREARRVGLILVFLCAASALPVLKSGQKGYNEIYFSMEPTDRAWLDAHMRTAEEWIWVFYLLAALALVAIVVPMKWPRSELPLVLVILAFGAGTFALSGYIAYLGGRVRHIEFREGPPPISKHH